VGSEPRVSLFARIVEDMDVEFKIEEGKIKSSERDAGKNCPTYP
jgi:hypothetical protein